MREVGVLEAKTHLSSLLEEVEGGTELVITRHGRPVARVVCFSEASRYRRMSGQELVDRVEAFHKRLVEGGFDPTPEPWEETKKLARR